MSKKVIILSGLPGSGKTYYADTLLRQWGTSRCRVVSADSFFVNKHGDYNFDPMKIGEAHEWCFYRFLCAIGWGPDPRSDLVIVDNTNLSAIEIAPYYLAGRSQGYEVVIQRVTCDPEVAFVRQRHGVPKEVFDRMVLSWNKRDVAPWWKVEEV